MKALCWHGANDVRIDTVPDPIIEDAGDIILQITSTAICGSDLHLLSGMVPEMYEGDILGHEFMGIVVETGAGVKRFKKGDRVVVPFTIACGHCHFCNSDLYSLCDNSNRKPEKPKQTMGHAMSGIFGYSHLTGGFDGGQAEYVRVPYADHGPIHVPALLTDEQVLFLSDIFPTGYMAAENAGIRGGETVAVWGCGPVGQMTIQSAWMQGAGRVIAIEDVPERAALARKHSQVEVIESTDPDEVYQRLQEMTDGRGPDACIDAVGAEAHGRNALEAARDKVKGAVGMETAHPYVLQQIAKNCKKGGTLSVPGVYVGEMHEIPFGTIMNKALTIKTGQTHVQRYLQPLLHKIEAGKIDPSFIITHTLPLDEAPQAYKTFRDKKDGCIKVVLKP